MQYPQHNSDPGKPIQIRAWAGGEKCTVWCEIITFGLWRKWWFVKACPHIGGVYRSFDSQNTLSWKGQFMKLRGNISSQLHETCSDPSLPPFQSSLPVLQCLSWSLKLFFGHCEILFAISPVHAWVFCCNVTSWSYEGCSGVDNVLEVCTYQLLVIIQDSEFF